MIFIWFIDFFLFFPICKLIFVRKCNIFFFCNKIFISISQYSQILFAKINKINYQKNRSYNRFLASTLNSKLINRKHWPQQASSVVWSDSFIDYFLNSSDSFFTSLRIILADGLRHQGNFLVRINKIWNLGNFPFMFISVDFPFFSN